MYSQGRYRDFNRGRRHADDNSEAQHGPVKVIFTRDANQVIDPPTRLGMRAGELRRDAPKCEVVLKDALATFEGHGVTFQHSVAIHGYIADFYCKERSLIVELDGPHHRNRKQHDAIRDKAFESHGIRTLRYPSFWAHKHIDRILTDIAHAL
jgi:very-short-patch-repair endonuclease